MLRTALSPPGPNDSCRRSPQSMAPAKTLAGASRDPTSSRIETARERRSSGLAHVYVRSSLRTASHTSDSRRSTWIVERNGFGQTASAWPTSLLTLAAHPPRAGKVVVMGVARRLGVVTLTAEARSRRAWVICLVCPPIRVHLAVDNRRSSTTGDGDDSTFVKPYRKSLARYILYYSCVLEFRRLKFTVVSRFGQGGGGGVAHMIFILRIPFHTTSFAGNYFHT